MNYVVCVNCSNKLGKKKVTYNINRKGYDIILRDVPALVCEECGEVYYKEKSVDLIQSLMKDVDSRYEAVRSSRRSGSQKIALV